MTKSDDGTAAPAARWPDLHPTAQAAYNLILWREGLPRIEIAKLLGVSRTRMSQITKDLEDAGLITEGPREQRAATGRPAEILVARPGRYHLLGVTVRSGTVVGAVIDLGKRVVREWTMTVDDPTVEDVQGCVAAWWRAATSRGHTVVGVAVTAPGTSPTSTGAGVYADDLAAVGSWGVPVPVWTQEDVLALTTFEQWPRLSGGQDSMVLLSLGGEIGFGVVTDLRVVVGAHHRAGRFGHVHVVDGGPRCPAGHRGCLWGTSSTAAVLSAVDGAATVLDVLDAAAGGDPAAATAVRLASWGAGVAAAQAVNLLDPDKVVVTGEVSPVIRAHRAAFDEGFTTTITSGAMPEVEVSDSGDVHWARAAAAYGQYRLLTREADPV